MADCLHLYFSEQKSEVAASENVQQIVYFVYVPNIFEIDFGAKSSKVIYPSLSRRTIAMGLFVWFIDMHIT